MADNARRCFVIMPFGDKTDADGKHIDFDRVYETMILPAVSGDAMRAAGAAPLECVRCDKIAANTERTFDIGRCHWQRLLVTSVPVNLAVPI